MISKDAFLSEIREAYTFKGDSIIIGAPKLNDEVLTDNFIRIPLKTLNRHGLIAGATGTGKTKTLQIIAEQLSAKGVPTLVMDVKGDLSGVAVPAVSDQKIEERHDLIGLPFTASGSPVEFLTLSHDYGTRLKATVTEFGPVLFSKILDLNDVQSSIISLIFKYCDDHGYPLLDLNDIKKVLTYITTDGKQEIKAEYGTVSPASINTIMRKIIELEQQGGNLFFGERSFEVDDLIRKDSFGNGIISILRVTDIQDRPLLFSTFMLQMLAEIYSTFPEEGDMDKPKLVFFIDEAHLIFKNASRALLNQIETIIKLIRSKGIGIFFVTQNPTDLPNSVLGQLGLKIQHALRAFTAKDRKEIKMTAENYPLTDYYTVDKLLTELGIGEALVTCLNEKGIPTPLVHCYIRVPQSRMDILTPTELQSILNTSTIKEKYDEVISGYSAYEILTKKMDKAQSQAPKAVLKKTAPKKTTSKPIIDPILRQTGRELERTIAREITRGIMGILGIKK